MDFDPRVIPLDALLAIFWSDHDPAEEAWSRQYMAGIWWDGDAQRDAIEQSRARIGGVVRTHMGPLGPFHRAEDYHQKHALRRQLTLMTVFEGYSEEQFEDSTVAMRLNALAYGHAVKGVVEREIDQMGLAERDRGFVMRLLGRARE